MNVIATNCSGGWLYRFNKQQFNNPFIWMVTPYTSIKYMLEHFKDINWDNFDLEKSKLRPNTFVIKVDNNIDIHYVHYKFDPKANTIITKNKIDSKGNIWDGDILYNHIWEYIVEKYQDRTKRLKNISEPPCFFIMEEKFTNEHSKVTLKELANINSPYKKIILTTNKNINTNNSLTKTIHTNKIEMPEPTIRKYISQINTFFSI